MRKGGGCHIPPLGMQSTFIFQLTSTPRPPSRFRQSPCAHTSFSSLAAVVCETKRETEGCRMREHRAPILTHRHRGHSSRLR
ncbi:hypothetical protein BC830DRAFT_1137717 [Chytriomyces sp. MP71]|nr:hypothetical protein BC830DRAFT_1137717 [Chytriomyces sp. MP71]